MRVHIPQHSQHTRLFAAIGVVLLLSAIGVAVWPTKKTAPQSQEKTTTVENSTATLVSEVVVADEFIMTGRSFDEVKLSIVKRSSDTIPPDAITSLAAIKGRVSAGPLSPRSVVTKSLLASPVAVIPGSIEIVSQDQNSIN